MIFGFTALKFRTSPRITPMIIPHRFGGIWARVAAFTSKLIGNRGLMLPSKNGGEGESITQSLTHGIGGEWVVDSESTGAYTYGPLLDTKSSLAVSPGPAK